VRSGATYALGSAFSHVPDEAQAWQDLHKLTQDEGHSVRMRAADALGSAFSHVPDKVQTWQDLHKLTQDEDSYVRMYAYHSLGRASVSKATEAHDPYTLKKELNDAVAFFEKSSQESQFGPAGFCYPFYRTYYVITFQEGKKEEVQRYLADAKEAVGGSEARTTFSKQLRTLQGPFRSLNV